MSDNNQKPRIIKTELGDGTSTVLPYGVSVDVSAATDKLRSQLKRLTPMGVPVGPKPVDNPLPPDPPATATATAPKKKADADADVDAEGESDDETDDERPEPPPKPTRHHARRKK